MKYTHQLLKNKKITDPREGSINQLLEQYSATDTSTPKSYNATKKAHTTMF